jgi:hypothetical protein
MAEITARNVSPETQLSLQLGKEVAALVERGMSAYEMLAELAPRYAHIGLTLDSVERLARQVADRRPVAKRYLQSKSLHMAQNVVENGKPADHVRTLEGLGEIMENAQQNSGGVTIIVGGDAHIALLHGPRPGDD